jgi:hypothetical protein
MGIVYRVTEWTKHFENNRTKELKHMAWVPVPNKHDGDGYTELLEHDNGAAHFGAWIAIVEVASKCDPRGTLLREGARPHDTASLSRITRIPKGVYDQAIPRLLHIGWLTSELVASTTVTSIPQEGAAAAQEDASLEEWNGTEGNGKELPRTEGVDEDEVVVQVRHFFNCHPILIYDHKSATNLGRLVRAKGWPYAERWVQDGVEKGKTFPVSHALGVWQREEHAASGAGPPREETPEQFAARIMAKTKLGEACTSTKS